MTEKNNIPDGVNTKVTTTRAELEPLQNRLQIWLGEKLSDPGLIVEHLERNKSSGMSNVSVLFTVGRTMDGVRQCSEYVLRMAPEDTALPVFREYKLSEQAAVMNAVADCGNVPVPRVHWVQDNGQALGQPFLVMDRAHGLAPQDNPPYVFDSWLLDESADELGKLQRSSVEVLAGIHETPIPESVFNSELQKTPQEQLRSLYDSEVAYYEWTITSGGVRIPLIDEGFRWLRAHWPSSDLSSTLCWGDARIGNILYRGSMPTAVLDWEAAMVGPPELDVSWFIFFHRMFQDMAEGFGKPGLPNFLRPVDVIAQYQELTGRTLINMRFFLVFAAVRCAIILARIKQRSVHFGDVPQPDTADEYVRHYRMLDQLINDNYDWGI